LATNASGEIIWDGGTPTPFGDAANDNAPGNAAFGEAVQIAGAFAQSLMFPGQYADDETGLSHNWHRTYDPTLGRYLQSDPIGLAGGLNRYAYVGGNPTGYFDFTGLNPGIDRRADSAARLSRGFAHATQIFQRNFNDMRIANTIGADVFFHCNANCEASKVSSEAQCGARILSDLRELSDIPNNIIRKKLTISQTLTDMRRDQNANSTGRGGASSNNTCTQVCAQFIPNGLPRRFLNNTP